MKKIVAMLAMASMLAGSCSVMAAEPEVTTQEAVSSEERNYSPESGTGWMCGEINGESVEFEFTGIGKGLTGNTYNFQSEEYDLAVTFNKDLEVDKEMKENSIIQIEIMSHNEATSGYYFAKKTVRANVDSTVTLLQKTEEGLMQGEFEVTLLSADRYVGDTRPGILPELKISAGEFCFCE